MSTLHSRVGRAALVTAVAVAAACGGAVGVPVGDASPSATYSMVLVAAGERNVSTATFDGANWASLAPIGMPRAGYNGGGITMLRDGRSLVALLTWSATLTGTTWSAPATLATGPTDLSAPVATDTGAVVTIEEAQGGTLRLATFNSARSTWTSDEDTALAYEAQHAVIVASQTGSDLFVLGASPNHLDRYAWTQRTQGTWSPPLDVPNLVRCFAASECYPAGLAAVRRAGTDTIVAAFSGTPDLRPPTLQAATFSSGTWSETVSLATDVLQAVAGRPLAMTALQDGRVALAYLDPQGAVWVGFFDGTSWGPFQTIGVGVAVSVTTGGAPVALAPGRDSNAVLELAFIEKNTMAVRHVRLLDAGAWRWSSPATVGTMSGTSVGLATTPVP